MTYRITPRTIYTKVLHCLVALFHGTDHRSGILLHFIIHNSLSCSHQGTTCFFGLSISSHFQWSQFLALRKKNQTSQLKRSRETVRIIKSQFTSRTGDYSVRCPVNLRSDVSHRDIYARNFHVQNLTASHITHVNYAFANINPDTGEVYTSHLPHKLRNISLMFCPQIHARSLRSI